MTNVMRGVAMLVLLGGVVGFAPSHLGAPRSTATSQQGVRADGVVVDILDDASSPTILVAAWSLSAPQFGLRTAVPRGKAPILWHNVFVNSSAIPTGPSTVNRAVGLGRPMQLSGIIKDDRNCFPSGRCIPVNYFGVRLRDAMLRDVKDTLDVNFTTSDDAKWSILIKHTLIAQYLTVVDSVKAAVKP